MLDVVVLSMSKSLAKMTYKGDLARKFVEDLGEIIPQKVYVNRHKFQFILANVSDEIPSTCRTCQSVS